MKAKKAYYTFQSKNPQRIKELKEAFEEGLYDIEQKFNDDLSSEVPKTVQGLRAVLVNGSRLELQDKNGTEYGIIYFDQIEGAQLQYCCGITEIGGLDPLVETPPAFRADHLRYVVSQIKSGGIIATLAAKQIKELSPAFVANGFVAMPTVKNPNTGNNIVLYFKKLN